jgi:hypothetical protein
VFRGGNPRSRGVSRRYRAPHSRSCTSGELLHPFARSLGADRRDARVSSPRSSRSDSPPPANPRNSERRSLPSDLPRSQNSRGNSLGLYSGGTLDRGIRSSPRLDPMGTSDGLTLRSLADHPRELVVGGSRHATGLSFLPTDPTIHGRCRPRTSYPARGRPRHPRNRPTDTRTYPTWKRGTPYKR